MKRSRKNLQRQGIVKEFYSGVRKNWHLELKPLKGSRNILGSLQSQWYFYLMKNIEKFVETISLNERGERTAVKIEVRNCYYIRHYVVIWSWKYYFYQVIIKLCLWQPCLYLSDSLKSSGSNIKQDICNLKTKLECNAIY